MTSDSDDGYQFGIIQDSLANSMGAAIPNRALGIISGEIGGGKSLIAKDWPMVLFRMI